jgi:Sds3-like
MEEHQMVDDDVVDDDMPSVDTVAEPSPILGGLHASATIDDSQKSMQEQIVVQEHEQEQERKEEEKQSNDMVDDDDDDADINKTGDGKSNENAIESVVEATDDDKNNNDDENNDAQERTAAAMDDDDNKKAESVKTDPKKNDEAAEKVNGESNYLERIEREFADLKEKFFKQKLAALKKEMEDTRSGTSDEFLKHCKLLEKKREEQVLLASQWRLFRLQNINGVHDSEKLSAHQQFEAEKEGLAQNMIASLDDRMRRLYDERNSLSLNSNGSGSNESGTRSTRKLRRRGGAASAAASKSFSDAIDSSGLHATELDAHQQLAPSHIDYTLDDDEILDDLQQIQSRAYFTSRQRSTSRRYD